MSKEKEWVTALRDEDLAERIMRLALSISGISVAERSSLLAEAATRLAAYRGPARVESDEAQRIKGEILQELTDRLQRSGFTLQDFDVSPAEE